jgi:hypothetical protein
MNRIKGSDATVDMGDIKSGDAVSRFVDQVVALSRVATLVPEITVASQSFLKAGFFRAVHVKLLAIIGDETSPSFTNGFGSPSFRTFAKSL